MRVGRYAFRMRSDVLVAALIIGLCGFAVYKQMDSGSGVEPIQALALGERLDPDQIVTVIGRPPFTDDLASKIGAKATVFMTWSIKCPCVAHVEMRLRHIYMDFLPKDGVEWVAINGEPRETPEDTINQMVRLRAFYKMLLDPKQLLTDRLGLHKATQVAVFDAEQRLVYRGPIDDNYDEGDAHFLREVLEKLTGKATPDAAPFEFLERPGTYGCPFDDPASCEEYEKLDAEREKRKAAEASAAESASTGE